MHHLNLYLPLRRLGLGGTRGLGSETDSPSEPVRQLTARAEFSSPSPQAAQLIYHDKKDILVGLGSVLERREDVWVGSSLDAVDKGRDFREERVVVSVDVAFLVVVSRATDVEGGSLVGVDQPECQYCRLHSTMHAFSPHDTRSPVRAAEIQETYLMW